MFSICANTIKERQSIRQHIHQYPELGFDVYNSAEFIANELEKIGLYIKRLIGKTCLIDDLKFTDSKKTIALRA
ncbi:amidohydrolase, partial [Francisella tularensis subsp. holarctica]|nr:amidohydrolase [Francisella tularensis subsp. holarctica]